MKPWLVSKCTDRGSIVLTIELPGRDPLEPLISVSSISGRLNCAVLQGAPDQLGMLLGGVPGSNSNSRPGSADNGPKKEVRRMYVDSSLLLQFFLFLCLFVQVEK